MTSKGSKLKGWDPTSAREELRSRENFPLCSSLRNHGSAQVLPWEPLPSAIRPQSTVLLIPPSRYFIAGNSACPQEGAEAGSLKDPGG